MTGVKNLSELIKNMTPELNDGIYVFATVKNINTIERSKAICEFKEKEGTTVIVDQEYADKLGLAYNYTAAWITLKIHSSLDAVGLTAAFSNKLAESNISCNVVAGYYHDHIFVEKKDAKKAIAALKKFSIEK
ncbi:ACT domain-containing protein [Cellulophaga sp. HaHaR_3_176]|uniref:ACT domain-containing protein n=1 Tax=Cellulophaga sp. HaHaR_3_176 TaxID=1942464 RepID=UPI001C1F538F|nr:ACT domain-containing protein [Cellulophaga sp. HaHaR_3_176]QWX82894.1 ACT domain-containing protein [Cellulophaga sp. HaHaR_3_176]